MKKNKKIIIISIIIMTILILITLIMVIFGNKIKVQSEKKEAITPDEIIDMLSYIPYSYLNWNAYNNAYHGEIMTSKNILPMVLSTIFIDKKLPGYSIENIEDTSIKKEIQENNIHGNIYLNTDIDKYLISRYNINFNSINDEDNNIKITKIGNTYTSFSFVEFDKFTFTFKTLIMVVDAYATSNSAVITEKTLFYTTKDDKYYVYKNTNFNNEENIIKIYDKTDEFGNELNSNDINEKIKEDFKDYKGEFIHTFKKNDTGYYWYSTEFVE